MNEEEKKTIEKFIEKCYKYDESVEIKGISVGEEYRMLNTVCKALNLIEKLQKENEELRAKWDKDTHILQNKLDYANADKINNYIPVSLVEEKIEELDKRIDFLNTELTKCYIEREKLGSETDIDNNETYIFYMEEEKNFREKQEEVLQELLREDGVIKWKNGKI